MKGTVLMTGLIIILIKLTLLASVSIFSIPKKPESDFGEVKRGNFEINIIAAGELIPVSAIDITAPDIVKNRNFRSAGVKILDLVPEGTEVNVGDYIASLDRTSFDNRLKDEMDSVNKIRINLNMVFLDSAVTLAALRDEIKDQYFSVSEAGITADHSTYEPPSVQRKAKLELFKSDRQLDLLKNNYKLSYAQTLASIKAIEVSLNTHLRIVNDLRNVLKGFTVTAPSHGMVIYKRDIFGNKIKTGSVLNPFNPIIASLPDLSSLLSKIYVSEVEINKVKTGQVVEISVDAFPGRTYAGKVAAIANIGDQLPNSDSKVFEVEVKLNGTDPELRPSMTTNNKFIVRTFNNVQYVPIGSIQAGPDSIPFVYTREGKKQIVIPGESNDKNTIIEQGLADGTSVWLSTPDNPARFRPAGKELIAVIKEREHSIKPGDGSIEKERTANSEAMPKSNNTKPRTVVGRSLSVPGAY